MTELDYEFLKSFGSLSIFIILAFIVNIEQGLVALDQWANTRFGGFADETISARAYRTRLKKRRWAFAYKAINLLFFWQEDHCKESYESEMARKQLPAEYRK